MKSNKKFIFWGIFAITILVMSVVTVCGESGSGSPDISASPSIVNPGDEITVTYSGAPGFYWDHLAIYEVGEQDIYEQCELGEVIHLLEGKKSGTLFFTAPDEPGDYEFRLFEGSGDTEIARSNIVMVQAGTTVPTPTPTTPSGVHHLGDQTLSDWEVPKPEGTEYTTTFSLTAVPASADIILDVFNIDYNNPVLVNGKSVGILCINPIKSWKLCTIKIPGSALRVGSNTLTIQSESRGGNYDDFMIRNIEVTPSSDTKPITPPPTTDAELVAYYPFDGDIRDYSGNRNDGTNHGATFVSGISGQALSFDGKDDYVQVPDSSSLDIASNNISLSAWVYFPEFVPGYGTIIEKTGSGGWNRYGVFSENDKLSFWLYTESIEAHTAVSANQWVHFVGTYDGINMKIYINGALDVEREQPGIDIKENNMPLMIGADPFGGGDYYHILIDEVKIYNCALSADEIKAHYDEKEPSAPTTTPTQGELHSPDVTSPTSGVSVVLHDGDARTFADPPDVIAYANTEYSMPPAEFVITTGGSIWRYDKWIALMGKDNWVEVETTVDTTAIGVQFWGDTNDGWARVLVDGSEVWTGDIYGIDSNYPGGAFVKYLEISGLTPGRHTIRVENMGVSGAGGGGDVCMLLFGLENAATQEPRLDELPEFLFGKLETFDFDNDGSDDKYVYTFETEEVAEDLFLDRSVEYEKTDSGFNGTLILEFENTGDETKTYSHIEVIPKSFAETVDDLEFSVPPDEIIDPDPKMKWEVQVMMRTIVKIAIKAKKAAVSGAIKGGTEAATKAGEEAAHGVVLDHLDDIVFINELYKCMKLESKEGAYWNARIGTLILRFPDMFEESDCEQIDRYSSVSLLHIRGDVLYAACKAITTDDWRACPDNIKSPSFKEVDACKLLAFVALAGKCQYIKDSQEKDECLYDAAVRADCSRGCGYISEEVSKNACLAEITQDKKYCKNIKDEDARRFCCDKLTDEDLRKECFCEEEEEVTSTPSTAPTITIPSGVHHLGDQTLTDWEVPKHEGTEYTTTFSLATEPARAYLILEVFQTDYDNPVLVNGKKVGFLCINRYKSWELCTISIPKYALKPGSNTLTIRAGRIGSNYDDFMIRP